MSGGRFRAPPPVISEDRIPAFDAVLPQLEDVTPEPMPPPDSTTQEDATRLPKPLTTPPPDDPAQAWEAVLAL